MVVCVHVGIYSLRNHRVFTHTLTLDGSLVFWWYVRPDECPEKEIAQLLACTKSSLVSEGRIGKNRIRVFKYKYNACVNSI